MNVIGTRPDAWWRDRHAAMTKLVDMLERWAAESGADVTVVFEKPPSPPIRSTVIVVAHAPKPRRDSADDEIIRLLRADGEPRTVRVVTSDQWLADRAYAVGCERRAGGPLPIPDRRRLMPPETRYAESDGASIAYQVAGEGNLDVLFLPGWISQIEQLWEAPALRRFLERLGAFTRLILFDSRGTGLSERSLHTYTLEQEARDALAVLDAAGSERVALFTYAVGGLVGAKLAAEHPDRVGRAGHVRLGLTHLVGSGLRLGDDDRAAPADQRHDGLHLGRTGQRAAGPAGAVDGRRPGAAVLVRPHPATGGQPPRGPHDRAGHLRTRRPRAAAHDHGADPGDAPPAGAGVGRAPLPLPGREHPRGPLRRAGGGRLVPVRRRQRGDRRGDRRVPDRRAHRHGPRAGPADGDVHRHRRRHHAGGEAGRRPLARPAGPARRRSSAPSWGASAAAR